MMNNQNIKVNFLTLLRSFLNGDISQEKFSKKLSENDFHKLSQISRNSYLKMKYGDRIEVRKCFQNLVPCSICLEMPVKQVFNSWQEFCQFNNEITEQEKLGNYIYVKSPQWSFPRENKIGQELFVRCGKCGATWLVVTPERSSRGGVYLIG